MTRATPSKTRVGRLTPFDPRCQCVWPRQHREYSWRVKSSRNRLETSRVQNRYFSANFNRKSMVFRSPAAPPEAVYTYITMFFSTQTPSQDIKIHRGEDLRTTRWWHNLWNNVVGVCRDQAPACSEVETRTALAATPTQNKCLSYVLLNFLYTARLIFTMLFLSLSLSHRRLLFLLL